MTHHVGTLRTRLMLPADVPQLAEIVGRNYCADYARQFRAEAAEALRGRAFAPTFWVVADLAEVIGCAAWIGSGIDWNVACLTWVNVAPQWQRRGIGRQVVSRALRDVASSYKVAMLTTRTPKWYEHWRFRSVAVLNGERDEPHHLMICELAPDAKG